MPEIRFTEEDHAFAREFVDRLEQSGVAGTVREFLSKEDAEFILFQSERKLRNSALMMRLAEAVISTAAVLVGRFTFMIVSEEWPDPFARSLVSRGPRRAESWQPPYQRR